jgi:hypothetical protein
MPKRIISDVQSVEVYTPLGAQMVINAKDRKAFEIPSVDQYGLHNVMMVSKSLHNASALVHFNLNGPVSCVIEEDPPRPVGNMMSGRYVRVTCNSASKIRDVAEQPERIRVIEKKW